MSEEKTLRRRERRKQISILLPCLVALNSPLLLSGYLWGWHARPPAYLPYAMSVWPVIVGSLMIWIAKRRPLPFSDAGAN